MTSNIELNTITHNIIGAAIEVHKILGPGLFEEAYEAALIYELNLQGLSTRSQVPIPIIYKGINLEKGYRADLFVNDEIIVELKSVEELHPIHYKQLLTYLKLTNKQIGILINFNVPRLVDGVQRIVNNY